VYEKLVYCVLEQNRLPLTDLG